MAQFSTAELPSPRSRLGSPLLWLGLACLVLIGLLTLSLTLPIGPFYWDLFIYFDAANRIFSGQIPAIDFFTPVGPLGYYLFAGLIKMFPEAQPLLLAQWSLLLVSAPLMALVLCDVDRRSRKTALALLIPFLAFSVLPFNVEEYYAYPGVDGFGIYNRQVCQLLYVLAAALVFAERKASLAMVMAGTVLALFLVKVTGVIAALGLCAFALAAGRIALRTAVISALICLAGLAVLELGFGLVSAYVGDILQLLAKNEGSLLPRFLQAASIHFVAFAPLVALTAVLAWRDRQALLAATRALIRRPRPATLAALLDHDAAWLGVAVLAGLFVETQNTGGQAFIFVWPMLLALLLRVDPAKARYRMLVLGLVAASTLPTALDILQRSARAFIGQAKYEVLDHQHLRTLGAVSQRPEMLQRSSTMLDAYRRFPETWNFIANAGELPGFALYTEPDFQITWLRAVDEAVGAVKAYEVANGVRFETVMSLNFVNPFPWLLERTAPRHIAIGADPFRAVPDPDGAVLGSVAGTDLVLYPLCPVTNANQLLLKLYAPGLTGHRQIRLSPCWDAYVRDGLLAPR